jgi:hypothetical protein
MSQGTKARSCTGKEGFTKAEAKAAAQRMAAQRFGSFGYYPCKFCGKYHVGHAKRNRGRQKRWR